ncbi:MAG: cell division protein FtsQ [Pseudonocardiales bacterium]|nr:cell division protein FtsQ [Pseudonocardiales bacterium]
MTTPTTYLRGADEVEPRRPSRRRTGFVVVAATVIVAVVITWLVAFSSVFGVRSVQVRGAHLLTAAEVRGAAQLDRGTPLVRVDTVAVGRRVEKLAEVASAQVSTSFPSTVVITITERQPVGYVQTSRRDVLVDRTGAQYRTVAAAPSGLPRFAVPVGASARSTARAVAAVAAALPGAVRSEVRSIEALSPSSITLVLSRGRVVQWGSATRTADKARLLPVLLKRGSSQIDLTDPDQPFTR